MKSSANNAMRYHASYYVEPEFISYSEYMYNDTPTLSNTRPSARSDASSEAEYVYSENVGEYVLDNLDMKKDSYDLKNNASENMLEETCLFLEQENIMLQNN